MDQLFWFNAFIAIHDHSRSYTTDMAQTRDGGNAVPRRFYLSSLVMKTPS
ncbi:MAG: hypothetical protein IPI00_13315 [Flavobacteriales bacterium]|nr:hypothetical protein [Flavobacteriales bacterium]MBK7241114.1 hypothetical protein [Flavobacteriales bacterium]MBK7295741.1 hypothetical protein [Flavobacteriales bacterium]MBK9534394.1 hypothetical protein [Flavobacteriales bacterium]MBP9137182.1 hypothetical protein [Flavobacteriales bacterium]